MVEKPGVGDPIVDLTGEGGSSSGAAGPVPELTQGHQEATPTQQQETPQEATPTQQQDTQREATPTPQQEREPTVAEHESNPKPRTPSEEEKEKVA